MCLTWQNARRMSESVLASRRQPPTAPQFSSRMDCNSWADRIRSSSLRSEGRPSPRGAGEKPVNRFSQIPSPANSGPSKSHRQVIDFHIPPCSHVIATCRCFGRGSLLKSGVRVTMRTRIRANGRAECGPTKIRPIGSPVRSGAETAYTFSDGWPKASGSPSHFGPLVSRSTIGIAAPRRGTLSA